MVLDIKKRLQDEIQTLEYELQGRAPEGDPEGAGAR